MVELPYQRPLSVGTRAFLVKNDHTLEKDYPNQFREIMRVVREAVGRTKTGWEDDLRVDLSSITYLERNRLDPAYHERARESVDELGGITFDLLHVFNSVSQFDIEHLEPVIASMRQWGIKPDLTVASLLEEILNAYEFFGGLQLALLQITGRVEKKKPRRGRVALSFTYPTFRLMSLWRDLTGEEAGQPQARTERGPKNVVGGTLSTQFVALGLQIINSKISLSNAETSIKNAIKRRDALRQICARRNIQPTLQMVEIFFRASNHDAEAIGARLDSKKKSRKSRDI